MSHRVLIVDDDASMCDMLEKRLATRAYQAASRTSGEEALAALANEDFDVVVTDLNMRGMNGIDLCERIAANRPNVPVLVITAFGSLETAIAAIRAGAYDFITKPFEIEQLVHALNRAIQHRDLRDEVKRLRQVVDESQQFDRILGASTEMSRVFDMVNRVARSDTSALIYGESGTGKELVARALHKRSHRSDGPFVAFNCAAVPETLLESELFGYEKGAFTDAKNAHDGLFVQADGGTLFLDEIGDMPLTLQPKLLRSLEERTVRPLGGRCEKTFDIRLVTATNRDLETAVEDGAFREDLYYRINVVRITLPPLRSRGSDILLLAQHFLELFTARAGKSIDGLTSAAAEKLLSYAWPGNVRELKNCLERAVAMTEFNQITVDDLPEKIRDYKATTVIAAGSDPTELCTMDEVERRYIARVMEAVGNNKTSAAKVLGFDRKTLYRKLVRYGMIEGGRTE